VTTDTVVRPASRIERLGFSDIVKIRNRVLELKQKGEAVLQLEGGEPFMPTPDFVKAAMKKALDDDHTRYAPSSGIPPLLEAISTKLLEKNGLTVTERNLIVTNGGMHALFCAFQETLNPGDEIIFFSPYWTPIKDLVTFAEAIPVRIPWEEIHSLDDLTDSLRRRLSPKSRAIYVNTPSNPTGDVLSRAQLQSIARFAIDNNLVVVSDEAYEDLVYGGQHVSIGSLPGMFSRTLSVFTLSKSFAMTGWRVGYIAADVPWMDGLRKLALNTINGVSTPSQWAAAAAIRDRSDYQLRMREAYIERRDILVAAAQAAGFRCAAPRGAFYLFANVRERLGHDSWKAMETLLERTRIASVPGSVFGPEGEGHLRMSFSTSIEVLEAAASALTRL
jgi:aspartate/methionine/tyrosine aminotransferase